MTTLDFKAYPHIVRDIVGFSDYDTLCAWRATSRSLRVMVDEFEAAEHLIVNPHSRSGRLELRTRHWRVPTSLAAWPALHDPGLPNSETNGDADSFFTGSEYVPSDDEDDDEMDIDADGMDMDLDSDEEEVRRARAEAEETDACAHCQAFEAAMLVQLPNAAAEMDAVAEYADELERNERILEDRDERERSYQFEQWRFGEIVAPNPDRYREPSPEPPEKPVIQATIAALPEEHEHEHVHEVANAAFWAARAGRDAQAKAAFLKTVSRTKVLDVPSPAILHDLEHFTSLQVIRYVGNPNESPGWIEIGAPTLVRFYSIIPTPDKWWEPVEERDMPDFNTRAWEDPGYLNVLDAKQRSLHKPVKKAVISVRYHPAHPRLSHSMVVSTLCSYNDELEDLVVIFVPTHPDVPREIPPPPPPPVYLEDHPDDCDSGCPCREETPWDYGPASAIINGALRHHHDTMPSWVPVLPRPRVTVVGLAEMGNDTVAHRSGTGYWYEGEAPYDTLSTVDRMYAFAAHRIVEIDTRPGFEWKDGLKVAHECLRFVSLDDYKAEVGQRQFELETVPPAVPSKAG